MAGPIIRASGLSKTYRISEKQPGLAGTIQHLLRRRHRDVLAVDGISFTIEPGEIVGFLGPNGAGKTTTLKMLTGLIHPSGGELEVAGHQPYRRQARFLRQITLVTWTESYTVDIQRSSDAPRLELPAHIHHQAGRRR